MPFQKFLYVVLALLYTVYSSLATTELYVLSTTSPSCPANPCLTLNDYVSNRTEYFTSNTSFFFMDGEHYLNSRLVLNNVMSISMSGMRRAARVIISAEANIMYSNSISITMSSLEIVHEGMTINSARSALLFDNSHLIQIVNVSFTGLNSDTGYSRALSYTQSTSQINSCSFSNGHSAYGGAININSSSVSFNGVNSYTNNTADISGGAVYAQNSTLIFDGTNTFLKNKASTVYSPSLGNYTVGGGSVFATHTTIQLNGFSNFTENGPIENNRITVLLGGAVMLQRNSDLTVEGRAIFSHNSAEAGGAVFAHSSIMHYQGDVYFRNNQAATGGAIYVELSTLSYQENITFSDNRAFRGGGVYAIDSTVEGSGTVNYVENTAQDGGGMGLEGTLAQLVLKSPLKMNFYRNKADFGGGLYFLDSNAIYVAQCQNTTIERETCYFKVEATDSSIADIHLNFIENSAEEAGTVLYGGALQLCQVQLNKDVYIPGLQFLENISTIVLSEDNSSYISSSPLKVCFCDNFGELDCQRGRSKTVHVKRGQTLNVSIITVGQFDMPSPSAVYVRAIDDNSTSFTELNPPNHNNHGYCSDVQFQLKTKDDFKELVLIPEGLCVTVLSTLSLIYVELDPCPPGFDQILNHCACSKQLLDLNSENVCDIGTELIERPGNAWLKPSFENQTYQGFIWQPNCRAGYCKPPEVTVMLDFTDNDTDIQCTANRTGVLCGACKEGYSLILNKLECKECENSFISLILVFGFAGIALIAILLALHLTVAAGTINGLILYVNFINICRDTFFPPERTSVNPLTLFIAWLNLDFGIPACLYNGLSAYSYAWLQFVFPLYLWFLIGLIICLSKISTKAVRLFGSNPIAVLATVILMSYTKLLQTTVEVLSYTYIEYPDKTREKRWSIDPNVPFMEGKHVVLAIFSLFVILLLLIPYILLLMFGYRLLAHSGRRGFRWFNKFKPLLDAYYAPYRNKTRYWTGFLLLIRGCLFLTFILTTINANLVAGASIFTAIIVVPWLSNGLYEKLYVDVLEASFLLNICILTNVTYHAQAVNDSQMQQIVTDLSVAVALIEFVGIVVFHVYLCLKKFHFFRNKTMPKGILLKLQPKKKSSKKAEEDMLSITSTVVTIREPLLEDD